MDPVQDLEKRLLHRFQVAYQQTAPFALDLKFDIVRAIDFDGIVVRLSGYVWSEEIQNETVTAKFETSYPATWWQHFKQRWFPAWVLRRWPVELTWVREEQSHRFKTVALLPEFRYQPPRGCGETFVIKTFAERTWRP